MRHTQKSETPSHEVQHREAVCRETECFFHGLGEGRDFGGSTSAMCLHFQILLCWAFSCMGLSCWGEGAAGGGVKSQSQALKGMDHIAALGRALGP